MADYSKHQKGIINRYYANRDTISLGKLQELVSELYMETSEKKAERLWQRVAQAIAALKVPDKTAAHILGKRDVEVLAKNLQDWLRDPPA